MKLISLLPLLTLAYAAQYKDCSGCKVVSSEDGVNWGIENKNWCIINDSLCNKNNEANKCPGYPQYQCCEGCTVKSEDGSGKWGIENGKWCSIKESCNKNNEANQCPGYPLYQCCEGCTVRSEDGSGKWGIENGKWCSIKESCSKNNEANQCPGYPQYQCCEGCTVRSEDGSGKWGIENGKWCSIKNSCNNNNKKETDFCKSSIVNNVYLADPAPLVVGNTLYVYASHDEKNLENENFTMKNWYVLSTKDMENWTNHGEILSLDDIDYAEGRAWAPQAVARNGKYYLYFPVEVKDGGMGIGVAVANSPRGPFKDAIGEPLIYIQDEWIVSDPTVFIDDDGQAYLYFGSQGELRYVKLNSNMTSYNKRTGIVNVTMSANAFGNGNEESSFVGGPFLYKKNGVYYMIFSGIRKGKDTQYIGYSTSNSPVGPWKYQGVLMAEDNANMTNHAGIAEFNGKSYLFYHTEQDNMFHRKVGVREIKFNNNGSINQVKKC